LLDERAHAGRENLDPVHVSRYDRKEDANAAREVELLKQLGLDHLSVVVDLGAGTGQFTRAVAPECARVIAVDVSPVMLDRLRRTTDASNVEVFPSGFLTYEHHGPPADFVYSRYALHHLPDFWKAVALTRIHHVLKPGGVLRLSDVVYNFEPAEIRQRVEAWCATAGTDVEEEWSRAELEEHVRDEHSTFTWLLEPMLDRCGFDVETAAYSPDGFVADYVARTR
jgi:SAM-dependent methyltransferase